MVSQFYNTAHTSLLPQPDTLPHHDEIPPDPHHIPIQSQELHCYFPEELYLSSILPTHTPQELRYLQNHCWRIYATHSGPPPNFIHELDKSHHITTSPLHFQNLFWRLATYLSKTGITEEFYWIKHDWQLGQPDCSRLKPAYSVFYPWVGIYWKTTQLDCLQWALPRTPTTWLWWMSQQTALQQRDWLPDKSQKLPFNFQVNIILSRSDNPDFIAFTAIWGDQNVVAQTSDGPWEFLHDDQSTEPITTDH